MCVEHANVRRVWRHAPRKIQAVIIYKIASESNQLYTYLYNVNASKKPCNLIIQFDHVQLEHVFIASLMSKSILTSSFKWNSNESDSHRHSSSDNYESTIATC